MKAAGSATGNWPRALAAGAAAAWLAAAHAQAPAALPAGRVPVGGCSMPSANPELWRLDGWSGSCRDGLLQGQGVLTGSWVHPVTGQAKGFSVEGRYVGGRLNGYAHWRWADGTGTQGMYRDDSPHGWARSWASDGSVYEGQWVNGLRDGLGTFTTADGTVRTGRWEKNRSVGAYRNRTPQGSGFFLQQPDGSLRGVVATTGGEVSSGTMDPNGFTLEGPGAILYANGSVFLGNLRANKPDGAGTYARPAAGDDASVHSGVYQSGCLRRGDLYTMVNTGSCGRP